MKADDSRNPKPTLAHTHAPPFYAGDYDYYSESVENRNEAQTTHFVYQAPPLITLYIKYLSSSHRTKNHSSAANTLDCRLGFSVSAFVFHLQLFIFGG